MPTAAPPRSEAAAPAPLVARLGEALAKRGVSYCQWKGHGKRERWESGRGDIDLLVDRAAWRDFAAVLGELGFKLILPPPGREAAGVFHYFGLDERTGKLIHVHAYARLVIGLPWRTHYRLPLERALLDSAVQQAVFKAPAPELELIVQVLRMSLRHGLLDPLRRTPPHWLDGALPELDRLEEQTAPAAVHAALRRYLPEVSDHLFERCRNALGPHSPPRRRPAARLMLEQALAAHRAPRALFAPAERVLRRLAPQGQRLAAGGSVIALLGGDGAGKSTCAEALDAWLRPAVATLHLHLGRPSRSLATLVVGGMLKLARLVGAQRLVAHLELLRHGCTARDRFRAYRKARRFAADGGIAICERYPTPEGWALAGPSEVQEGGNNQALDAASALAAGLRRWERRYYERMAPPDLTFVLVLDAEKAVSRKPAEPADYVRERARLIRQTDWSRSGAREIDAAQPLPQVIATLKAQLWSTL